MEFIIIKSLLAVLAILIIAVAVMALVGWYKG